MTTPVKHTDKYVLVAPLDWGLGHATRTIPIIMELEKQGAKIIVGASGKVKNLLQQEFRHLMFLELPGYGVTYSKFPSLLPFQIAGQIPKILDAMDYEQKWLEEMIAKHHIGAVISDNRYGLHHPSIPSVFITHQLLIKAPSFVESILQKLNYRYINRFNECWVPDYQGENNLAGDLSHPTLLPKIPVRYIGPLSRFSFEHAESKVDEKHLLILLSGPEPQRTFFEEALFEQSKKVQGPIILVRGLPGKSASVLPSSDMEVFNHLPSDELEEKILSASYIISRCGYSTVMDIAALQKKAILIPTPGQTEQEYLAKHLMKKNFALCIPQSKFRLSQALELAHSFTYNPSSFPANGNLHIAVKSLLNQL